MIIYKLKRFLSSKYLEGVIYFFLFLLLLDVLLPLPPTKQYSKVILAKDGTMLSAFLTPDDKWRMETNLDEVSPDLIKAIITKEDSWYYWHLGVNPVSVIRALFSNITSGRVVSGASTISMQVVRILEPGKRNYLNKIGEMLRAVQLEFHYSKKEILEIYLSHLPFGGNIEGVKSAAYIYFNRPPSKLSLAQSVLLAEIPNNPNKYRLDKNISDALKARNFRLKIFIEDKNFPKKYLEDALNEPLVSNRYEVPFIAPHFSNYINQNYNGDNIHTSLDLKIQQKAENLLYNYVNRVKSNGVTNGAVLIIDNKNHSVAGYCGSSDYYDTKTDGQVNGVVAVRSPGSTLKPALYAHAFDLGSLTPQMKLLDIPTDYYGYAPENYDLQFHGDITAAKALLWSLNVPAVRLLESAGLKEFIDLLINSGFDEIKNKKDELGLSVILGGCGVSLEQLTSMYSCFACDGNLHKLNYILHDDHNNNNSKKIFSPEASYLIADILSNNYRPDFSNDLINKSSLPRIAWKTGTSYGKRDAWAVGFNPRYTIGVWMGNFDGKGSPELSGANMAVPLLFDLFNSIENNSKKEWFKKPDNVLKRKVCAETGLLPTKFCTQLVEDDYIKNVSHNKVCGLYKELYVNDAGTMEYCPDCMPSSGVKKKAYPIYDPGLKLWYDQNNIAYLKIPPHNPACQKRFTGKGLKIISPSEDYEYYVEEKSGEEILLQAVSETGSSKQFWYINDRYFITSKPGENIFYKPGKGRIKISCIDDKGRSSDVTITVNYF